MPVDEDDTVEYDDDLDESDDIDEDDWLVDESDLDDGSDDDELSEGADEVHEQTSSCACNLIFVVLDRLSELNVLRLGYASMRLTKRLALSELESTADTAKQSHAILLSFLKTKIDICRDQGSGIPRPLRID